MTDGPDSGANLTDFGQRALGPLPVAVEVSPGGIERMAAILHIMFAHKRNPHALERTAKESNTTMVQRHHEAAWQYIQQVLAENRRVMVEREVDGLTAQYRILAKGNDAPATIRVDPTKPLGECVEMMASNGAFVRVDMERIFVR